MIDEMDDAYAVRRALGAVVEQGRGALPFALVHGEALVACAAWALGEAGVSAVDVDTQWAALADHGGPCVLHDPLCPMTPSGFLRECLDLAIDTGAVVVAVDGQGAVLSPVVLPGRVVAALPHLPSPDFVELVAQLEEQFAVVRVEAPMAGARVGSVEDVAILQALTGPEDT